VNPRTILPIALFFTLAACASTGSGEKKPASAPSGGAPAKDEAKAEALQKKERELSYAKLQLQITVLEQQADARSQQNAIAEAERGVRRAEEELSDYQKAHKALEQAERELSTDQQKENLRETQQEFDELESMYKDEDFAKKTKELVLSRGKARLDFSRRGLEIAATRRDFQTSVVLPRKERDLNVALEKARTALEDARGGAERKKLSNQLQMLRAEDGIKDLEKEIEKLKGPAGKPAA
jgi:hypothetical protein